MTPAHKAIRDAIEIRALSRAVATFCGVGDGVTRWTLETKRGRIDCSQMRTYVGWVVEEDRGDHWRVWENGEAEDMPVAIRRAVAALGRLG